MPSSFWVNFNDCLAKGVDDQQMRDMKRSVLLVCPSGTTIREIAEVMPKDAVIIGMQNDMAGSFILKVHSMLFTSIPEGGRYPTHYLQTLEGSNNR